MFTRFLLAAVVVLAGCGAGPVKRAVPFDEAAHAWALQLGTAAVHGEAFFKTAGGEVKYCAGELIVLAPATPYTEEAAAVTMSGRTAETYDPRYAKFRRVAVGDGRGGFEFTGLPAGRYLAGCCLSWAVTRYQTSGGCALVPVEVRGGERKRVIVTR